MGLLARSGHSDQVGDPAGFEAFPFRERPRWASPNAADDRTQFPVDDVLAQDLVGQPVLIEKMIVKEMAVGSMSHVVQQPGQAEQFLHIMRRRGVGAHLAETGVEGPSELARHVHRAQGVLEAAVLRRRIDPARALKLADPPQPLHPGGIDQFLLRGFRRNVVHRHGEGIVLVDRVGDQGQALIDPRVGGGLRFHGRRLT